MITKDKILTCARLHPLKACLVLLLSSYSIPSFAQVVCHDIEGEPPGKLCRGHGVKFINFLKMPSWDGHASLMLIQACSIPSGSESLKLLEERDFLIRPTIKVDSGMYCHHSYCSMDAYDASIKIGGHLFSFGIIGFSLSITFEHQNFELRCEEVAPT